MSLTAAELAELQRLPLPLRALALDANAGDYSSIVALVHYWDDSDKPVDENACRALLPVLLVGLDPKNVPDAFPEDPATNSTLILRAKLCLDLIGIFMHFLSTSEYCSAFISTNHHRIFPWLSFLSIHFVGVGGLQLTADHRLAMITEESMIFTLSRILNSLNPKTMNLQPNVHTFIVDVVIDIWRKMLYIDVASVEPYASVLAIRTVAILDHFLASPTSLIVIDKLGGRSSLVVLCLAHVEQATQRSAALPLTDSNRLPFKALAIILLFMFSCLSQEAFMPEIELHNVIPRSSSVVNLLIEHYNAIQQLRLADDERVLGDISSAIHGYCCLIMTDTWALSPPLLLQSLKSGTPRNLRTRVMPSLEVSEAIEDFVSYMAPHSIYPAVLKHTSKLLKAYLNHPSTAAWTGFNTLIAQYCAAWSITDEVAQRIESCSTCMVPRSQRGLKICGGCRTVLYCSVECQRIGREQGHRLHCKLLQFSQAHSSLIGGCHGLLFLALLETVEISDQKPHFANLLSSTPFSPNEIPLIVVDLSTSNDIKITRMADYPHIFGDNELWEKELIPLLKATMDAMKMPRYLTVLELPRGKQRSYVLGAVASCIISGLLDWDTLIRLERC